MDFDVEYPSEVTLPDDFNIAYKFWSTNTPDGKLKAVQQLQPYIRAWFVPMGITDSEILFPNQNDVKAFKTVIIDLDFSDSSIPRCKAEAWFKVKVSREFVSLDLIEWQEINDQYFYQCISFGWEIPIKNSTEKFVLTYENHFGVDCLPNIKYKKVDSS